MKRRMILILCFALLLSLAVFAVAQAAGLYASELIGSLMDVTTPEGAVGAPDGQYAVFGSYGGPGLLGLAWSAPVSGSLCVYAPKGSTDIVGLVGVYSGPYFDPYNPFPGVGFLRASNYANGRYTVKLFVVSPTGGLTTTPYTGKYQSVAIVNLTSTDYASFGPLSVDAVLGGCGAGQNGQGQNNNRQGQNWNWQDLFGGQNWQGQNLP